MVAVIVVVVVAFVDVVRNDENKGEKKYYKIDEFYTQPESAVRQTHINIIALVLRLWFSSFHLFHVKERIS